MATRNHALWLRLSAAQLVAQWTARRAGTKWAENSAQRDRLIRQLCIELLFAIASRIPDQRIARGLRDLLNKELGE